MSLAIWPVIFRQRGCWPTGKKFQNDHCFTHSVFQRRLHETHKNQGSFGKGLKGNLDKRRLTLSKTIPGFHSPTKEGFRKHCVKRRKCIFSISHNVLFPILDRTHHLSNVKFVVCKCFQFDQLQNFIIWLGVKRLPSSEPRLHESLFDTLFFRSY